MTLVQVLRGSDKLYDGPIGSLRRGSNSVPAVGEGFECGITCQSFDDYSVGDFFVFHEHIVELPRIQSTSDGTVRLVFTPSEGGK